MGTARFPTREERFFRRTTARPGITLALAAAAVAGSAAFLPLLTRNTSADAFIPFDHPSLVQHRKLERVFGRADPMVIAVVGKGSNGVFTPEALGLVAWLTERVASLPGIDPERVTSLTTATDAFDDNEEIRLEPLVPRLPANQEEAAVVGRAVMRSEERDGAGVYADILDLARQAPPHGAEVHVAGEAAVTSYLDITSTQTPNGCTHSRSWSSRLSSLSATNPSRVLLPIVVVAGAVVVALGSMAALRVPFYVITNALPVIIVAIGVADSIHILGRYYERIEAQPRAAPREVVVRTMADMWRPVTLTSVTDMAGFLALGLALADERPGQRLDPGAKSRVGDLHTPVATRRTDVDQRRELHAALASAARVVVRPPDVLLTAAGLDQHLFRIRVQLPTDGDPFLCDVHDVLHHILEPMRDQHP